MAKYEWADGFWREDGRLMSTGCLDELTVEAHREEWRRDAGLPDGVAEDVP